MDQFLDLGPCRGNLDTFGSITPETSPLSASPPLSDPSVDESTLSSSFLLTDFPSPTLPLRLSQTQIPASSDPVVQKLFDQLRRQSEDKDFVELKCDQPDFKGLMTVGVTDKTFEVKELYSTGCRLPQDGRLSEKQFELFIDPLSISITKASESLSQLSLRIDSDRNILSLLSTGPTGMVPVLMQAISSSNVIKPILFLDHEFLKSIPLERETFVVFCTLKAFGYLESSSNQITIDDSNFFQYIRYLGQASETPIFVARVAPSAMIKGSIVTALLRDENPSLPINDAEIDNAPQPIIDNHHLDLAVATNTFTILRFVPRTEGQIEKIQNALASINCPHSCFPARSNLIVYLNKEHLQPLLQHIQSAKIDFSIETDYDPMMRDLPQGDRIPLLVNLFKAHCMHLRNADPTRMLLNVSRMQDEILAELLFVYCAQVDDPKCAAAPHSLTSVELLDQFYFNKVGTLIALYVHCGVGTRALYEVLKQEKFCGFFKAHELGRTHVLLITSKLWVKYLINRIRKQNDHNLRIMSEIDFEKEFPIVQERAHAISTLQTFLEQWRRKFHYNPSLCQFIDSFSQTLKEPQAKIFAYNSGSAYHPAELVPLFKAAQFQRAITHSKSRNRVSSRIRPFRLPSREVTLEVLSVMNLKSFSVEGMKDELISMQIPGDGIIHLIDQLTAAHVITTSNRLAEMRKILDDAYHPYIVNFGLNSVASAKSSGDKILSAFSFIKNNLECYRPDLLKGLNDKVDELRQLYRL